MSPPDPRTEVVFEKMTVDEIITGLIGVVLLNGNTGPYRRAIHSALTTEAARHVGKWSTARPTRDGWYWWRRDSLQDPIALKVDMFRGEYWVPHYDALHKDGEWCPIARPSEEVG